MTSDATADDVTASGLTVEARLAELEAASDARRAELRAVLDDLPHAISRRTLVVEAARDLRRTPDKGQIAKRALAKLGRAPRAVARRMRRA